ncbi:hypothetical protein RCL10_05765 [Staphylococcus lloydii]|uniref:hypothetical protein n=1 Tax=Staphylococcus lloydii TaxID=2781774 RepID=UPI00065FE358|nr:hypothetical protein [Staphylococcus lloydii]MDU9418037.1 hypothetical protein [Staphylococcus lloydii]
MTIKPELDKGYFISTLLNVFFLFGLIFIMKTENLFILIPYTIIIMINAMYLVIKAIKIKNNNSNSNDKLK